MPYIKQDERARFDEMLAMPSVLGHWSAGEIAYVIYCILKKQTLNASFLWMASVVGAVLLTTFRFIMVVVMPYEDRKQAENGDV